ncbi:hypothetical protein BHE74_00056067 [Ensete ventricosum]|nr:hypothetical protein GW17_00041787 [Ensete ventricosum]RWW38688.1 hypothetical protein BHE74_00056067 [Ensete ventricosum]RZS27696.1 hypothetical protein BHM03_00061218 [Ensete ventricosum]
MVVANACGAAAAAAATATLLRPPPSREARHLSLAGPALRRPILLMAERGAPSLSLRCSNSATTSGGGDGGGSCSHWDWNRWSQHFSDTDQAESLSSALKVVALQRVTENLTQFRSSVLKTIDHPAASSSKYSSTEINPTSEVAADNSDDVTEEKREKRAMEASSKDNINNEDSSVDTFINFLKERIPGFEVKVVNVTVADEIKMAIESLGQLVKEDDDKNASSKDTKYEDRKSENIQGKMLSADGDTDSNESKDTAQVFVGGVTYNKEDGLSKSYMRVPAEMNDVKKDSFILHVRGKGGETGSGELKPSKIRVAAAAAESASDLMPSDLAKAFLRGEKAIKVSKTN